MATQSPPEFMEIFTRLTSILAKYAGGNLKINAQGNQVELLGPPTPRSMGRQVWFGAVRVGKRYVSYHLMPVYACPDLLAGISPRLKKRMQGKSCFNFTHIDEELFQELALLTEKGYERFIKEGFIIEA